MYADSKLILYSNRYLLPLSLSLSFSRFRLSVRLLDSFQSTIDIGRNILRPLISSHLRNSKYIYVDVNIEFLNRTPISRYNHRISRINTLRIHRFSKYFLYINNVSDGITISISILLHTGGKRFDREPL